MRGHASGLQAQHLWSLLASLWTVQVHNIVNATNPTTAAMLINVFADAVSSDDGKKILPSFYTSLESPAVAAYKAKQNAVIASHGGKVRHTPTRRLRARAHALLPACFECRGAPTYPWTLNAGDRTPFPQ